VNRRRRQSLAFLASLLGHTLMVGGFATGFTFRCVPEFEMPELDLGSMWPAVGEGDQDKGEEAPGLEAQPPIAMPEPPPMPVIDWAEIAPPMPEVPTAEGEKTS
jgi:hypothetical protein